MKEIGLYIEKLLIIVNLGQKIYGWQLVRQLLSGGLAVLATTLIVAILISALLLDSLYAAYVALLQAGASLYLAAFIICLAAVFMIAALLGLIANILQRMREGPRGLLNQSALPSIATDALGAFIKGFTADRL